MIWRRASIHWAAGLAGVTAAVAAVAVAVPGGSASASAHTAGRSPTTYQAYQMHLRKEFGFPHGLAVVKAADRNRREVTAEIAAGMSGLGIPLSPSEQADLATRDALGARIPAIERAVAGMRPRFGGVWMDQAAEGVLHVDLTGTPSGREISAVRSVVPPGSKIVLARVARSNKHLDRLSAVIAKAIPTLKARGVVVESTGTSLSADKVQVAVSSDLMAARAALDAEYGAAALTIVQVPPGSWTDMSVGVGPMPKRQAKS